jgi:hypothetical protein
MWRAERAWRRVASDLVTAFGRICGRAFRVRRCLALCGVRAIALRRTSREAAEAINVTD